MIAHRSYPILLYLALLLIYTCIGILQNCCSAVNEHQQLGRCCANGARHYRDTGICISIPADHNQTTPCRRASMACCLRMLLETECLAGVGIARKAELGGEGNDVCSSHSSFGAAGRECCTCCLLARELVTRGETCKLSQNGFSDSCRSSFSKCCEAQKLGINSTTDSETPTSTSSNSCDQVNCEHSCSLKADGAAECSCRTGYELASDGRTCEDVDECLLLADNCHESQRCFNIPGSYKCIRTLTCGSGYALDSETERCVDVDECVLGSHDCGPLYQCRNTPGSYRCDPKRCAPNETLDAETGRCVAVNCPSGYTPRNGGCEDVDECASRMMNICGPSEECVNTPGSYRCQARSQGQCSDGFVHDAGSGLCMDKDECADNSHTCGPLPCINTAGGFKCRCHLGFEFNDTTRLCEDIDECRKFTGHVCSSNANCENTFGSFRCRCRQGYQLAEDARTCEDIDECATGQAGCHHQCINTQGGYQCLCNRGFQLGIDERSCEDIDECSIWAKSGNDLCMGECINTYGSFTCSCPTGYELQADNVMCKDIDECAQGHVCRGENKLCVNTLGSFKCQTIECPRNYKLDKHYKNRCVRKDNFCEQLTVEFCKKQPVHISWQHIAIPKLVNISSPDHSGHTSSLTLFSMKGPASANATMQFELRLVDAVVGAAHVKPAVRGNFLLQKGADRNNSAIIALRDPLDGPQKVHLELILRLSVNGVLIGKYIANLHIHVSQYRAQSHSLRGYQP